MRLFTVLRWLSTAVLCSASATAVAQRELGVVCSVSIPWCEAVAAAYLKETGVSVNITVKDSGDALSQLAVERATPKHDVWFAGNGESHLRAAEMGLMEEYRSPLVAQLHDWAVRHAEESRWYSVGLYAGILGFGYNNRSLAQKRLAEPKCWSDLAKPEYLDEVQTANPVSSRAGYIALATLVQVFGEDQAFDLLKGLHRNVRVHPRTAAGAIRAASRGETTIGVALLHDAMTEVVNGFPITLVLPCEGTGYELEAMSIVAGAPHMADAKRFYDWALTPAAQRIARDTRNFQVPSNKSAHVSSVIANLGDLRLIRFDFQRYFSAGERKRLLEKWDREVNAMQR